MATPATLPSLPVELLHQISKQLSYGSHIALSFTCRKLYIKLDTRRRLSASSTQGKTYNMTDLLEIEGWPEYNPRHNNLLHFIEPHVNCLIDFLACRICLKIRSAAKFPAPFRHCYGKRYGLGQWQRSMQVCIPCAVANHVYGHAGESYNAWDMLYVRECCGCHSFSEHQDSFAGEWICGWCRRVLTMG